MGGNIKQIFWRPYWNKKEQTAGFLVVEPENLKFQYVPSKKKAPKKTVNRHIHQKRKRQTGDFLGRYDFAFADRETVNQAAAVAPGVIKAATNDTDRIAKEWIIEVISQGGKEIEHVLPKRGAIEDVY